MAKTKRKATGRARANKPNGKLKPHTKRTARKPNGPRSQVLPGLEQVRSKALDNICEGLAEERRTMNAAKLEEQGLIKSALQTMVKVNVSVYKHAGIELARVPGAEKVRVRLVKEDGDAGEEDLEVDDEIAVNADGETADA